MSAVSELAAAEGVPSSLRDATVVLVGNHTEDRLLSMERYARMLYNGLTARHVRVLLIHPTAWVENWSPLPAWAKKYARYLDKYFLSPLRWPGLLHKIRRGGPVIVHVTDQGNGLYLPWLRGFPCVVTNHDLLAIRAALGEFPRQYRRRARGWGQRAILKSLTLAETVVCVSEQSLEDGRRLLDADKQRFFKVLNAVETSPNSGVPLTRPADLPESYVLHVGGSSWYKNRVGVLRIYAAMRRRAPNSPALVLVGDALNLVETHFMEELGITETVIVRQRPPDSYVMAAYAGAEALIFPSIAEGFGWPILEAMAAGCPVFTSNRAPMTEVGGSVAEYIDPENPEAAATLILQCLAQGPEWRKAKSEAGRSWAATFTPDRMITEMLEVYAATLNRHKGPSL
ncbi:MAG: glycosyl transferase family 1 [Verrucomicrobiaceae bacterium]|nr:glycosyl transferase family 1 [Verrucomicrobiaceae bacterium]